MSKLSKAEAARKNGAKGGRPRKRMRADPPATVVKPTGKWALTRREEQFVHQLVTFPEKTQGQCYIDAGFRAKNTDIASANAGRLIKVEKVAKAIAAAKQVLSERHQVTQDRVVRELGRLGFFDARKLFESRADRPGGHVDVLEFYATAQPKGKPFTELSVDAQAAWVAAAAVAAGPATGGFFMKSPDALDDDTAAALAGVEVVTRNIGDGEVEHVHKFKFADKLGALNTLAKHLGLLRDKPESPNAVPLFALPADARPDVSGAGT